jgi:single-stranded DNA-binding protein
VAETQLVRLGFGPLGLAVMQRLAPVGRQPNGRHGKFGWEEGGDVISISIVGRVTDRPFRPGNGQRVVFKIDADDDRGRTQHLELDAFGEIGDWVMKNLTPGEVVAVNARLEIRTYRDQGEEIEELRIVGMRIEPLRSKGAGGTNRRPQNDRGFQASGSTANANLADPDDLDDDGDDLGDPNAI